MGIHKLFDGSTFLPWGLNELFTWTANLLEKPNVSLYTEMPSLAAEGPYITATATKSQAKRDDDKWTVHHCEAV